jgi:4-hydroxy-tetrahydrodipicolinate reductase
MKIKIALFGFGKTGKVIAQSLYNDERFELVFILNNQIAPSQELGFSVKPKEEIIHWLEALKPDIVVDFSSPDAVISNIDKLTTGMGYIIGTTGFKETELDYIKNYKDLKVLLAPNISDGINVLMILCRLLNKIWLNADVEIIEEHFKEKKDAPSGTAKKMANLFDKTVPIHSVRAGGITGVHKVILATENQKISLEHESFNKSVFAEGVKRAALWLINQKRGFYEIDEVYIEQLHINI